MTRSKAYAMDEQCLESCASWSQWVELILKSGNFGRHKDNKGLSLNLVESELNNRIGFSEVDLTLARSWTCCLFQRSKQLLACNDPIFSNWCFNSLKLKEKKDGGKY